MIPKTAPKNQINIKPVGKLKRLWAKVCMPFKKIAMGIKLMAMALKKPTRPF